ncbi:phosphoenolpyruvate carboxylase kinase 1-like [Panicum virgatum]|uniref:phosphoenolpyruvate carboxylase kinase 1-like n=1 Tax=Panicum virgatum TaxID=38727 RepID=UPI0019D610EB|nr:phosphoenolpyruvate carboxylase kinase 1-like [Panicum virgatum]
MARGTTPLPTALPWRAAGTREPARGRSGHPRAAARGRLRRGAPVTEPVAAAIVAQLAQALALCHRRGVAHRDVKPDNILIDAAAEEDEDEDEEDGRGAAPRARLADFGSAAWVGAEGLVGTPHYVAPEVVAGGEYGAKADVWSAGVVMYALLSGGESSVVGSDA